jgi:uncharacterized membrane protein YhaH (DUF805 family)
MLSWLFGFQGEIGRARYVAGLSLLIFSALALILGVALTGIALRWPRETWVALTVLVIFALGAWSILALSTRRLRDLGAPPILVLGGLALLGVIEAAWSPVTLANPWGDALHRPITALLFALVGLALIACPGQTAERAAEERSPGVAAKWLIPLTVGVAGLIGLGLVFDPLQRPSCPLYGAGSPGDDCASRGVIGRYYSGLLVVQANRRLDRHDPAGALKLIDQAVAVRPGFVFAFNSRGLAYDQLKDRTQALRAYDQALALQPTYVHGLINRAILLDALGRRDRALADLHAILRAQPDNAVAKAGVDYITNRRR